MASGVGLRGFCSALAPAGVASPRAFRARNASTALGFVRALNPRLVTDQYSHTPKTRRIPTLSTRSSLPGRIVHVLLPHFWFALVFRTGAPTLMGLRFPRRRELGRLPLRVGGREQHFPGYEFTTRQFRAEDRQA